MITVQNEIVINRPVEVVFAAVTDIANLPKWQGSVAEAQQTTPGPIGVGTRGRLVRTIMGQRLETTFEVTDYVLNQLFAVRSLTGPVSFTLRTTFSAVAGGTRVQQVLQGEPQGFFKVAEPLLASMITRDFQDDFARLKKQLEG